MATPSNKDKHVEPERHGYGPRPVGALLPALLRPSFKRRSPAAARILSDWEAMVGPELAAMTTPRRLTAGVLLIGCSGPVALELQHLSDQIAARINTHLGSTAVSRIRLVQEFRPPPAQPPARRDDGAAELAAAKAVAALPPGPLQSSLLRLGRRVLARTI